jgi:hypothetical protein
MNNEPVVCAAERVSGSAAAAPACLYFIMFTRILHHLARGLCDRRSARRSQIDAAGNCFFMFIASPSEAMFAFSTKTCSRVANQNLTLKLPSFI